jgi:uncharacterized protein (TIGR03437 family)
VVFIDRAGGAWVASTTLAPPPVLSYPSPPSSLVSGTGLLAHIVPAPANQLIIRGAGYLYSGRDGPLAPGELATITLAGFQSDQTADLGYTVPLPTTLAGAQVLFDGEPAVLADVFPWSIGCVTPYDLARKSSTTIQVKFNGQVSTSLTADVQPVDLGVLSADGSGQGQAYAPNEDGTLNSSDNPAKSRLARHVLGDGTRNAQAPPVRMGSSLPEVLRHSSPSRPISAD